jgi:hypothetical protein
MQEQPIQPGLLLAILDASRMQIRTTGYTLIRMNGVPQDIQSRLVACYGKLEEFDAMITVVIDEMISES